MTPPNRDVGVDRATDVRGRFLAAAATGRVPEALARELINDSPSYSHGPWRLLTYEGKVFDYGAMIGMALWVRHDRTGEHRYYAIGFSIYRPAWQGLARELLQAWLNDLNRNRARGWPEAHGAAPWALRLI